MMKKTEFYGKKSPKPRIFFLGLVLVILSALVVLAFRLDDEEDEWTYDMGLPIILIDTGGETLDPNVEMEETMVNGEPMMLFGNSERYKASLKLYYRDPYDFGDKGVRPEMETDVVMNVPDYEDFNSLADFKAGDGFIEIKIPWELINVINPMDMLIFDDFYLKGVEKSLRVGKFRYSIYDKEEDRVYGNEAGQRLKTNKKISEDEYRLKSSYFMLKEYWGNRR